MEFSANSYYARNARRGPKTWSEDVAPVVKQRGDVSRLQEATENLDDDEGYGLTEITRLMNDAKPLSGMVAGGGVVRGMRSAVPYDAEGPRTAPLRALSGGIMFKYKDDMIPQDVNLETAFRDMFDHRPKKSDWEAQVNINNLHYVMSHLLTGTYEGTPNLTMPQPDFENDRKMCFSETRELQNYQKVARYIIGPESPLDRLLYIASTGAGKTFIIYSVIEAFFLHSRFYDKECHKFYYVAPNLVLQNQFVDQILTFPGVMSKVLLAQLRNKPEWDTNDPFPYKKNCEKLRNDIRSLMKKIFNIQAGVSYTIFSNHMSSTKTEWQKQKKMFQKSVIFLDEVHYIMTGVDVMDNRGDVDGSDIKATQRSLNHIEHVLRYQKNHKLFDKSVIVGLTATPIHNDVTDLFKLVNMLNGINLVNPETFEKTYLKNGQLTTDVTHLNRLRKRLANTIAMYDNSNDGQLPRLIVHPPIYVEYTKNQKKYMFSSRPTTVEAKFNHVNIAGDDYKKNLDSDFRADYDEAARKSSRLQEISPKLFELYDLIQTFRESGRGPQIVYSSMKAYGTKLVAKVLVANGFVKYESATYDQREDKDNTFIFLDDDNTKDSMSRDITVDEKMKLMNLFNSPENRFGEVFPILVLGAKFVLGLDFKNVGAIHVLDQPPLPSTFTQLIGRARRFCSHKEWGLNYSWTVNVFQYMAHAEDDETGLDTDELISRYPEQGRYVERLNLQRLHHDVMNLVASVALNCESNFPRMQIPCFYRNRDIPINDFSNYSAETKVAPELFSDVSPDKSDEEYVKAREYEKEKEERAKQYAVEEAHRNQAKEVVDAQQHESNLKEVVQRGEEKAKKLRAQTEAALEEDKRKRDEKEQEQREKSAKKLEERREKEAANRQQRLEKGQAAAVAAELVRKAQAEAAQLKRSNAQNLKLERLKRRREDNFAMALETLKNLKRKAEDRVAKESERALVKQTEAEARQIAKQDALKATLAIAVETLAKYKAVLNSDVKFLVNIDFFPGENVQFVPDSNSVFDQFTDDAKHVQLKCRFIFKGEQTYGWNVLTNSFSKALCIQLGDSKCFGISYGNLLELLGTCKGEDDENVLSLDNPEVETQLKTEISDRRDSKTQTIARNALKALNPMINQSGFTVAIKYLKECPDNEREKWVNIYRDKTKVASSDEDEEDMVRKLIRLINQHKLAQELQTMDDLDRVQRIRATSEIEEILSKPLGRGQNSIKVDNRILDLDDDDETKLQFFKLVKPEFHSLWNVAEHLGVDIYLPSEVFTDAAEFKDLSDSWISHEGPVVRQNRAMLKQAKAAYKAAIQDVYDQRTFDEWLEESDENVKLWEDAGKPEFRGRKKQGQGRGRPRKK